MKLTERPVRLVIKALFDCFVVRYYRPQQNTTKDLLMLKIKTKHQNKTNNLIENTMGEIKG
jgi:hypothetical protein